MPSIASISLILHAGALVLIYSVYSLLQEKIMKTTYDDQKFTSASLLVLSNRLFSLLTGIAFSIYLPSSGDALSTSQRLAPKWPRVSYAVVAAANFASTYCQYDALRYVGFTTQALAKCAKMVPVLLIGSTFYKKSYKSKEYVAGGVVLLGCFVYLSSRPTSSAVSTKISHDLANTDDDNTIPAIIGGVLLCAYLFFDGLTSTTQEHYFGKNKKDIAPLTPGGPVLDQMVWVNLMATVISAALCFANFSKESLTLAFQNPSLSFDIAMLSGTATFGLVILYDTIFKHGALTVATTMTLRQFFSILLNAGVFGNLGMIGFGGWLGVGFVAAGVFIKMDRRFDVQPTRPRAGSTVPLLAGEGEKDVSAMAAAGALPLYTEVEDRSSYKMLRLLALQYAVPLAIPPLFALGVSAFV